MPNGNASKSKIAVLGAGPAGLATAWGLTTPDQNGDVPNVEVTVYEASWRAGGKCTSARIAPSQKLVQNGTHYLFGVYFNTFAMMEKAFNEINDPRFGDMTELVPRNILAMKQRYQGAWTNWKFEMPPRNAGALFQPPLQYLLPVLQFLAVEVANLSVPVLPSLLQKLLEKAGDFVGDPGNSLFLAALKVALEAMRFLSVILLGAISGLEALRLRLLLDFALTMMLGILRDNVLNGGIEQIDKLDFAAWLLQHGAEPETVECPLVRAWYEAVAAFTDGDPDKPSLSAAAVLQTVVPAVLAYQGAFCYQMKPEVGENMISPVYQALLGRGVKFRFLHELRDIEPSSDGTRIEKLTFRVPRIPGKNADESRIAAENYTALEEFTLTNGTTRVCWPAGPQAPFDFLGKIDVDRPSLRRPWGPTRDNVVRVWGADSSADFHRVVFCLPHLMIPRVASKLMAQNASQDQRWNDVAEKLPGVETKSVRLWLRTEFTDLEWDPDVPDVTPIVTAYQPLFSTWEDSGQQLSLHTWPSDAPKSIATIFGPLKSRHTPYHCQLLEWLYGLIQQWRARNEAREFLMNHPGGLWPGITTTSGALDWTQLVPPGTGPEALATQWVVANTGASERYTHAAPGTFQHRLRSGDTGYENLSVAGEWTKFWPATANVELTVMSGLRAAYDITGNTADISGEGGFFPS